MLRIHPEGDSRLIEIAGDKWYITHNYNGDDILQFELDHDHPFVNELVEETYVKADRDTYVIKTIEDKSDFIVYTCEINKDDFGNQLFDTYGTGSEGQHLFEILGDILEGTGWGYTGDYADYREEIVLMEQVANDQNEEEPLRRVTMLEILDKLSDACGCVFNFDTVNKNLIVVNPDNEKYVSENTFFTDEMNIISIDYVGTSEDIVTRMYAYGRPEHELREDTVKEEPQYNDDGSPRLDKNGNQIVNQVRETVYHTIPEVNIAGVTGTGKNYVEDHSYTDKVIGAFYTNENCDDPNQLLEEATAALKEVCCPKRSYTIQLDNSEDLVHMYDVVWIIDSQRDMRTQHQVVTIKEYPDAHHLDEVTLSQEAVTISKLFQDVQHDIVQAVDDSRYTIEDLYLEAIQHATDMITGSTGGTFQWILDENGGLRELVNLGDADTIADAKQVWRWNEAGLGHSSNGYDGPYDLALLKDGSINATMITTGTLNAVRIKAGILSDVNDYNFWNMETGEFSLRAASTKVGDTTLDNYVDNRATDVAGDIASTTSNQVVNQALANAMTQRNIFDKLTDGGKVQGIVLSGGQLYINATYINTGTLDADLLTTGIITDKNGSNYWNLDTGQFRLSASTTVGTGSSSKTLAQYIEDNSKTLSTQKEVFNLLTNNGIERGIYMTTNQDNYNELYISGDFIQTGYIQSQSTALNSSFGRTNWNLNTGEFTNIQSRTVGGQSHDYKSFIVGGWYHSIIDSTTVGQVGPFTNISNASEHWYVLLSFSWLVLGGPNGFGATYSSPGTNITIYKQASNVGDYSDKWARNFYTTDDGENLRTVHIDYTSFYIRNSMVISLTENSSYWWFQIPIRWATA